MFGLSATRPWYTAISCCSLFWSRVAAVIRSCIGESASATGESRAVPSPKPYRCPCRWHPTCLVDLRQFLFHFGDVGFGLDHIRMVVGVARLQSQQCATASRTAVFAGSEDWSRTVTIPRRQLLRQHRLGVRLVLLRPVQRLRIRIQLRIQPRQDFQIVLFVSRKLAHVLLLESRQFGIQIIQIAAWRPRFPVSTRRWFPWRPPEPT